MNKLIEDTVASDAIKIVREILHNSVLTRLG